MLLALRQFLFDARCALKALERERIIIKIVTCDAVVKRRLDKSDDLERTRDMSNGSTATMKGMVCSRRPLKSRPRHSAR